MLLTDSAILRIDLQQKLRKEFLEPIEIILIVFIFLQVQSNSFHPPLLLLLVFQHSEHNNPTAAIHEPTDGLL